MSHYSVAVFADSIYDFEMLLDPYNENDHKQRFVCNEEEVQKNFEKFLVQNPSWENKYASYLKEFGYKREGDELVKYYNPNAKWDYYMLDGRDYLFDLKPGVKYNYDDDFFVGSYRKNDYDYSLNNDKRIKKSAGNFWDSYVVKGIEPDIPFHYSREYYLERYKTKEQYAKECAFEGPFAFITPDGVWHAPGNVMYFAEDDCTAESMNAYIDEWNAWIADTEHNPYVSFVDCHI